MSESEIQRHINKLKGEEWIVRREAAEALGVIGDKSAVPALIEALKDDRDYSVRRAAVTALGCIGDRSVVPALIAALKDKDWDVGEIVQLQPF